MYSLMIVDDDDLIRERLKATIPFKKLGLRLCCEASDGETAFELYEQHKPQIVISDINIPLVNGLDFARRVLEENRETGIIIITGYGTLDFAQKAIKSGMSDFILKPIDNKEIEGSLSRIIGQLDEKAAGFKEKQDMRKLLQESLPLLQKRYLSSFLNGSLEENEEDAKNHLGHLGINLAGDFFCVAVLIPNYYEHSIKDREMIQIAIENTSQEIVTKAGLGCIVFYDALSRLIVIAYGNDKNIDVLLEKQLLAAKDKLRFYFRYDFAAGIGWCVDSCVGLPKSYKGAGEALGYKNSYGENNIVNVKNVLHAISPRTQSTGAEREKVIELLKNCDEEGLCLALRQYFLSVVNVSGGSEIYAKQLCIELTVGLLRCANDNGLDIEKIFDDDPYARIILSPGLHRIQKQIEELCGVLVCRMKEKNSNMNSRLVEQAKKYIMANFANPELGLTMVSESVGLSKTYFCSLFKHETGCNFTEYINTVRVDKAKALLASTNLRVYEVAEAVGYLSPKYFFQVFKRITNKRPRDFSNKSV